MTGRPKFAARWAGLRLGILREADDLGEATDAEPTLHPDTHTEKRPAYQR
jgi:hypothetical protein